MIESAQARARLIDVPRAVEAAAGGGMVIVVGPGGAAGDAGNLVMAASAATPDSVNFMATHARGLICVPMRGSRLEGLGIPPMASAGSDGRSPALHVGVDHASGTTGISAGDRAAAIVALGKPESTPGEFLAPGHVFPIACSPGGVLARPAHAEAALDLVSMAGRGDAAVACEIASSDGELAQLPELERFAERFGLPLVTISALVRHRRRSERHVERAGSSSMTIDDRGFRLVDYRDTVDGSQHLAAVLGDVGTAASPLVRLHFQCLAGDVFGARDCRCGPRLRASVGAIIEEGVGAVVYLRGPEGRGVASSAPGVGAFEHGDELVEAARRRFSGWMLDGRDYGSGMQILADLGVQTFRSLVNSGGGASGDAGPDLEIVELCRTWSS